MNLITADGVLKGLHKSLSRSESDYLTTEFRTFYAEARRWTVSNAGEYIWDSLTKEHALEGELQYFQENFLALLRCARGPSFSPRCGCAYHQEQIALLRKQFKRRQHQWLKPFLDILSSIDDKLHVSLPGLKVEPTSADRLSRFMLLENFVRHHTSACGNVARKSMANEMITKLAPPCSAGERYDLLWKHNLCGRLKGGLFLVPPLHQGEEEPDLLPMGGQTVEPEVTQFFLE